MTDKAKSALGAIIGIVALVLAYAVGIVIFVGFWYVVIVVVATIFKNVFNS